jgi:hypothetical protein
VADEPVRISGRLVPYDDLCRALENTDTPQQKEHTMAFGREPALFLGAIGAIVNLAVGFGLDISVEQQGLIGAAVLAIVSFSVRQSVTPVS